jgi:5-methylcytosine-specific restriction enzyme B
MNFFSIRTNDQNTIGQILNGTEKIVFDRLSWHKDDISIDDIIFIVISGDSSKKNHDYKNGLRAIGKVSKLPIDVEKHFNLEVEIIEFLPKTIMKEDFYIYPSLKDAPNIGPETKQAPNQAFRKIEPDTGKSIIRALFDMLPNNFKMSTYDSIVENNYKIIKLKLNSKNLDEIKKEFRNYLKQKVERESTISQYLAWMNKIQEWFIEKKIVNNGFNIWYDTDKINEIQLFINDEIKSGWKATNKSIKNWMSSPWNAWVNFNNNSDISVLEINNEETVISFDIIEFSNDLKKAGLIFSPQLIQRFVASLCTKPFVICSGLSGSGKTKLAQAFAQWICYKEGDGEKNEQYCIVPVGADWTNREPLLGYPNALSIEGEYVSPENGVLDLMIRAKLNIENSEEPTKPYFLILDEMNLSHVERYFADFLSTMESGGEIPLHKIENDSLIVPPSIKIPKNLFIVGTVNIDETTYMFSPKVLDRANTIEFRLTEEDLEKFINSDDKLDMDLLKAQGANMSDGFMAMALQETDKNLKSSEADLKLFFSELKKSGAEFGYRTASEIGRLMFMLKELGESGDNLLDIAIMQKLLPKLHGSRNKLTKVLPVLGGFCLTDNSKIKEDYLDKFVSNSLTEVELKADANIKYKISFEKICRMYKNAVENGFASYAEA